MPKVHLVIPNYNHYDLVHQLLYSLYRNEGGNIDSVLVIDDCSTDDEVLTGLYWWMDNKMLPLNLLGLPKNSGFLLTANEGLKYVCWENDDADIVILLSTDVKIYGKFIFQIKDSIPTSMGSLVGGVVYTQDTGWNTFNGKTFPYAEGWLLATTVEGWKELGYFDEQFAPNDFEDVDLSTTALSRGYQLVALNTQNLHHMGGQTIGYNPERQALTERNRKKFEAKWINSQK